jgi:hypothetical protein
VKLLNEFAQHGQNLTGQIAEFAASLQAARLVAERAPLIQERRERQNLLRDALSQLEEKVKAAYTGPARA